MKKILICIFMSMIMLVSFTACGTDFVADDVKDQVSNVVQSNNKYVLMVQNGSNNQYPNITYKEAFENFFGMPTWKYFKGVYDEKKNDSDEADESMETVEATEVEEENKYVDVVEFTGNCTYMDVEVKARIQFVIDEESETFSIKYLSFNEVPQNLLILTGLLEKVFTSYKEGSEIQIEEKDSEKEIDDLDCSKANKSDIFIEEKDLEKVSLMTKIDQDDELNELLRNYYDAYCKGDIQKLKQYASPISENEKGYIEIVSKYYEKNKRIKYYCIPNEDGTAFYTSVYSEILFKNCKGSAVALDFFYVESDNEGKLHINNLYSAFNLNFMDYEVDSEIYEKIQKYMMNSEFLDLQQNVQNKYDKDLNENPEIYYIINEQLERDIKVWANHLSNQ